MDELHMGGRMRIQSLSLYFGMLAISPLYGCQMPGSDAQQTSALKVESIQLTDQGILRLQGNIDSVTSIQLNDGSTTVNFNVLKKSDRKMEVGALSAITFVPGKLYSLIVSTAEASEVIPIQVESPKQGASGPQGVAGPTGPSGAPGQQGPAGAPGRGRSIVIKRDGQVAAYYMGAMNGNDFYDGGHAGALLMLADTGKIITVDLISGGMTTTSPIVYYSGLDCTGEMYFDYRISTQFPTKGRVTRTLYGNKYFEIISFATRPLVKSSRWYSTSEQARCVNKDQTLGYAPNGKVPVIQEVSAPQSLVDLAPLNLELE